MDLDLGTQQILLRVYPDLKVRIIRVYNDVSRILGFQMRATSGMRDMSEQLALWRKGRDEDGNVVDEKEVVTRARPGSSFHNFGLAVDSCFRGQDPYWAYLAHRDRAEAVRRWSEFGRICKAHGLVWGGDWNGNGVVDPEDFDNPHAQISYGLSLRQVQDLYKYGGIRSVFTKLDQIRNGKGGSEDPEPPRAA